MAQIPDVADFASFLDLDLDLAFYNAEEQHKQQQQQQHEQMQDAQHQLQNAQMADHIDGIDHQDSVFDFSMPVDVQFDMSQQHHQLNSLIPPTPNSVEMHPDTAAHYLHQLEAQRALLHQYQMKQTQSYTPLTSPVVTSNEARYHMSNGFTVPGAYFSPLTSPALEGQTYSYAANTSASSVATSSPIEIDVDMQDHQPAKATRRTRKRPNAARTNTTIPRTDITAKPQRGRKNKLSQSLATNDARDFLDTGAGSVTTSIDSVSPEPLSENPMPPPTYPASATHSPALLAAPQSHHPTRLGPATPASLMRMQQQARSSPRAPTAQSPNFTLQSNRNPLLTPLSLPEAAASMPLAIDPNLISGPESPESTSRKTPKLGPLSTPSGQLTPGPTGSHSPMTFPSRKSDAKGARGAKKRGSISSSSNTLISPAIRPKISPSIKPLLPEGASSAEDAHTMFLANRSNYQNLIEGTHIPGVNYPTELSTNLTSKRTSHKIAEQGRRNRINLALQEMLRLLPRTSSTPKDIAKSPDVNGDGDAGGEASAKASAAAANGNSKAATVESAIEYIKALKQESEEMRSVTEERERENAVLRKKVLEMERKLGGGKKKGVGASKEAPAMSGSSESSVES